MTLFISSFDSSAVKGLIEPGRTSVFFAKTIYKKFIFIDQLAGSIYAPQHGTWKASIYGFSLSLVFYCSFLKNI